MVGMRLGASLSYRQTLATRHEMALSLAQTLRSFRETPGMPGDEDVVREAVLAAARSPGLPALEDFAHDEHFVAAILEHVSAVAKPEAGVSAQVACTYVFRLQFGEHSGEFRRPGQLDSQRVELGDFRDALFRPDALRSRLAAAEVGVAQKTADFRGSLEEARRLSAASEAASVLAELVGHLQQCCTALFAQRPAPGEPRFLELACRKVELSRIFDPQYSAALLARFASRFRSVRVSPARLRNAFLNTLGEYALVGYGILAPHLFKLYRWSPSSRQRAEVLEQLKAIGVSEQDVLGNHLRPQYCNRWAVTGRPLNWRTDDAVLDFVTKLVRKDAERIFQAFSFEDFLADVAFAQEDCETPADAKDAACQVLVDLLESPEFSDALGECAAASWHGALREFLR